MFAVLIAWVVCLLESIVLLVGCGLGLVAWILVPGVKELLNAADVEELAKFREARARRTHYLARGAADNVFKPMLARAVKTMSNRRRFVQEFFTTEREFSVMRRAWIWHGPPIARAATPDLTH